MVLVPVNSCALSFLLAWVLVKCTTHASNCSVQPRHTCGNCKPSKGKETVMKVNSDAALSRCWVNMAILGPSIYSQWLLPE